jgi:hypothetical protein
VQKKKSAKDFCMAHAQAKQQHSEVIPFYTLRAFLDAEYSVVMTYGFWELAQQALKIRKFLKELYNTSTFSLGKAIDKIVVSSDFQADIVTFFFILIIFVMLVDDYYRARIITFLAPCRSVHRFSLDVIIGFFYGLTFLLVSEQSSLAWTSVALAFLARAAWSKLVRSESFGWESSPGYTDERVRSHVPDDEWKIYRGRLTYMISSHLLFGFLLICGNSIIINSDFEKEYYKTQVIAFLLMYGLAESVRFFAEARILYKNDCDPEESNSPYMLKTIVFIPDIIKSALFSLARVKLNR